MIVKSMISFFVTAIIGEKALCFLCFEQIVRKYKENEIGPQKKRLRRWQQGRDRQKQQRKLKGFICGTLGWMGGISSAYGDAFEPTPEACLAMGMVWAAALEEKGFPISLWERGGILVN